MHMPATERQTGRRFPRRALSGRAAVAALILALAPLAPAEPQQTAAVVDVGGGWASNAALRTVSAIGQSGGSPVTSGGALTHYAGFLGGAALRPRELGAHGLPLEADPDNDADGLRDADELDGSAFGGWAVTDPNAADTDADGMDDAQEAVGMYDPNDPDHVLRVLSLTHTGAVVRLTWIGRGGGTTNAVLAGTSVVSDAFTNVVRSAAYPGGVPPWYKLTNSAAWKEPETTRFYRVGTQVLP